MGDFPSEVLFFFLLAGLLRRGTFPSPEKYPKGRWGDPGPGHPLLAFGQFTLQPPFFIQSDTYKGDTRLPLNVLWACGHLVTGAVGYALRLTALGLKVASCFADGSRSVSRRRRKHDIETKIRLPLQKAVRRSWTRYPPEIRSPEESVLQWQCSIRSGSVRLDKGIQNLGFGVFLDTFCTSKKYPGVRGRSPRQSAPGPGPGRPGSQAPKRLASEETPRRCRRQKQNSAFASQRDKGAKDLCGTTLLAPETGATQACDVTVTPGGAYWGCGGKPAGLVGAAAPRGSSRRAASSALPPKWAALCGGHAGYSSLSTQLSRIAIPYYRQFPDLSTTFPGKKAPVRSNPAHKAVKGATVTRPMEPTTVWISSEATYL